MDQKEVLEIMVGVLKEDIDYLDPELRKQAEGMIIKAEIYLAACEPKKEK